MQDIRLITFDLDNTLWDVDRVIIRAERNMVAWIETHAPAALAVYQPDIVNRIRAQVIDRYPQQRHDLSFMRTQVLEAVMHEAGYASQAQPLAHAAFDVFFQGRNEVEFFPNALDMLAELKQSYQLLALTNGNADIHRAGLGHLLDGAFSSADVGASKPNPKMFEAALDHAAVTPAQMIHVGDNLVDDIQGASEVGAHSIWVNFSDAPAATLPSATVNTLADIPAAIERIRTGESN